MNARPLLTVDELAALAGVPVRTVRFYIAEGLLPGASTRGKGASYTQEHLDRLQLIRLLVARHLPLAEIRALVTRVPSAEVSAVVQEEQARTDEISAQAVQPSSPKDYLSALLEQARSYPGQRNTGRAASSPAGAIRRNEQASPWQRWELAPGIELHVRADVVQTESETIERILQAIRIMVVPGTVDNRQEE
jgi:DNA-binding transcriptional MerR regulator